MKRNFIIGIIGIAALLCLGSVAMAAGTGEVSIRSIDGYRDGDTLNALTAIHFKIAFKNNFGLGVNVSNGYKISTPDGAAWDSVTIDTLPPNDLIGTKYKNWFHQMFDIAFSGKAQLRDITPSAADYVYLLGAGTPGDAQFPDGMDTVAYQVSVWQHTSGTSNDGKHICIDSAFYAPGGTWVWVGQDGDGNPVDNFPAWTGYAGITYNYAGGGYCFLVKEGGQAVGDDPSSLPKQYALKQNYPNPFNPDTRISYDLPVRGKVTLTIYNVLGQRVKTLVDGDKPAGSHEITWDGSSDNGGKVASGIYFYKIEAGTFVQTKKMVLMK